MESFTVMMSSPLQELRKNSRYDRKLRIALLGSRGVPHSYGGFEALYIQLAPRLVQRGHEVLVYNRSSLFAEKPSHYKGARLIYRGSIESKSLGSFTHSLTSILDVLFRKVDVILCVNAGVLPQLLIPRMLGKNVCVNMDGLQWMGDKWGGFAKRYLHWNAKIAGRICPKGIITDAYEMHRVYMDEFQTPSACIAYGANIEVSENPQVLAQYGLSPRQYYLIASRMVPENNADLIIDAFNRMKTDKVLAIAGNANYKSEFVDKIKRMAGPRVRFLGHISNLDHIKELHCCCYAYVHGHTLGGINPAMVKALGYGNMILALNTLFNYEAVQDAGILFERNVEDLLQKLQYVEDHPEVAAEYRICAPERIRESFTWDHIVDQYEEFFLQLAAGDDPTRIHSTVASADAFARKHAEQRAVTLAEK
jgi:glycosyltransferase involved in cell wall biosynthesis